MLIFVDSRSSYDIIMKHFWRNGERTRTQASASADTETLGIPKHNTTRSYRSLKLGIMLNSMIFLKFACFKYLMLSRNLVLDIRIGSARPYGYVRKQNTQ